LAQKHGSPVLSLGAAGAGLDVDKAIEGVGRVGEHTAKFEALDDLAKAVGIFFNGKQGRIVIVGTGQFEQFLCIADILL
jgi:N-acetylglucosamine kinase-like BadF-type ATPase